MRLTTTQIQTLREKSAHHFGADTHIWLFGSRTDDTKKGGDIDLLIEPSLQDPAAIIDAKLALLRDLHQTLGEQKIDIIIRRTSSTTELPIHRIAYTTGIQLA
jgi:predicted nucleotidyltransferase